VVLVALAVPLPRNVGPVEAIVRLQPGSAMSAVEVALQPADAAKGHSLALVSWQGGGRVLAGLREVGPGRYASTRPVPVAGGWKSMVSLQRGDEVMAVPVYLPADPEIGAPEVPAVGERRERFVRNTEVLLRETHAGPPWVRVAAYAGLAVVVATWWALFALCARAPRREAPTADEPGTEKLEESEQPEDWSSALHRNLARAGSGGPLRR
ncbi:MAG: hypothetical protein M3404_13840, partial [Actinomycetota bacterium]|nr:hypothetical protein [Actinomycetota bacterium]